MRYLRTDLNVESPAFSKHRSKSKGKPIRAAPSKRPYVGGQRAWRHVEQHVQVPTPCTNQHCVTMNTVHTHTTDEEKVAAKAARAAKTWAKEKVRAKDSMEGLHPPWATHALGYNFPCSQPPLPPPMPRPHPARRTSRATFVTRRDIISLSARNGWCCVHRRHISRPVNKHRDWVSSLITWRILSLLPVRYVSGALTSLVMALHALLPLTLRTSTKRPHCSCSNCNL
jgi:hypothetical protein